MVTVSATSGAVRFTGATPNAEGVVTELLFQKVSSMFAAAYDSHFRSQVFVDFGDPEVDVPATPGCYACAIRFVKVATGETTGILRLGTVRV